MSAGTAQIARLLALTPYLQRHQGISVAKAAADFGITPAQLRKDLGVAYFVGLPGLMPGDLVEIDMELVDDEGVIFLTNAEFLARPMRFTPDEVLALVVALRSLRAIAPPASVPAIDSALAKLETAAGESAEAAARVDVRVRGADDTIRDAIARAERDGVRLSLTYDSASRGETTERLVDPRGITVRDGYAYLEAWSDAVDPGAEGGWRSFRLDRVVAAEPTTERAGEHGDPPPPEQGWLDRVPDAETVMLRLAQPASWVAEYYPVESVTRRRRGLEVSLKVADPGFLTGLLLRLGDAARVIEPADAARGAGEAAADALAQYAALFGDDEVSPT
ncbi:helix-turn-helix transcriptional regulator [Mariniluteicoccus flavus]